MASNGERRMLFDTSGKRKQVIRVVYAILALLMGASLFLVVGPVNIGELIGNSSTSNASQVFEEQAEEIEGRLAKSPNDEQLLLALTRARINAGNAKIEPVAETERATITLDAKEDFQAASETWNRYLRQAGDEPNPIGAQLVAATFFRLAESGGSIAEVVEYTARAAKAQRIAAEERPSLGSLSTLAIYEYFVGDFAAGDKAAKQAAAKAPSKSEAKPIEQQLTEFRKRGKEFEKQKRAAQKRQQELGREALQSPFGRNLQGAPPAEGE
jgi:hypothetical protein